MTFEQFRESIAASAPPPELPLVLAALWWDRNGNWTMAHECAQQGESADHAWVHAYLHRKEGDLDNARYWYGRAGKAAFNGSLEQEWKEILQALLQIRGGE